MAILRCNCGAPAAWSDECCGMTICDQAKKCVGIGHRLTRIATWEAEKPPKKEATVGHARREA